MSTPATQNYRTLLVPTGHDRDPLQGPTTMSRATASARGDFTEILEALQRVSDDAAALSRMSDQQLRDILDRMPSVGDRQTHVPADMLARLYADAHSQPSPAQDPPIPEPEIVAVERSEDEIVAEQLKLVPELSIDDLFRIRREYALANHPDRVAPDQREQATRRMTIANMLIDQAVRQKRNDIPARN